MFDDQRIPELFREIREKLKANEDELRAIKEFAVRNADAMPGDANEVIANIMLSIRHIEDARMRLGKAIQYSGDGVSIYDK